MTLLNNGQLDKLPQVESVLNEMSTTLSGFNYITTGTGRPIAASRMPEGDFDEALIYEANAAYARAKENHLHLFNMVLECKGKKVVVQEIPIGGETDTPLLLFVVLPSRQENFRQKVKEYVGKLKCLLI